MSALTGLDQNRLESSNIKIFGIFETKNSLSFFHGKKINKFQSLSEIYETFYFIIDNQFKLKR